MHTPQMYTSTVVGLVAFAEPYGSRIIIVSLLIMTARNVFIRKHILNVA